MKLPYVCPEHPKGQVKHTWDSDIYDCGQRLTKAKEHNHRYECNICGRHLASTLEESSDANRFRRV